MNIKIRLLGNLSVLRIGLGALLILLPVLLMAQAQGQTYNKSWDVIIWVDNTGSMTGVRSTIANDPNEMRYYIVQSLIQSLREDAQKNNLSHRVLILGLGQNADARSSLFKPVQDETAILSQLQRSKTALDGDFLPVITNTLSMFETYSFGNERQKLMILVSDGETPERIGLQNNDISRYFGQLDIEFRKLNNTTSDLNVKRVLFAFGKNTDRLIWQKLLSSQGYFSIPNQITLRSVDEILEQFHLTELSWRFDSFGTSTPTSTSTVIVTTSNTPTPKTSTFTPTSIAIVTNTNTATPNSSATVLHTPTHTVVISTIAIQNTKVTPTLIPPIITPTCDPKLDICIDDIIALWVKQNWRAILPIVLLLIGIYFITRLQRVKKWISVTYHLFIFTAKSYLSKNTNFTLKEIESSFMWAKQSTRIYKFPLFARPLRQALTGYIDNQLRNSIRIPDFESDENIQLLGNLVTILPTLKDDELEPIKDKLLIKLSEVGWRAKEIVHKTINREVKEADDVSAVLDKYIKLGIVPNLAQQLADSTLKE
jgi:hypothetical protein